MNERTYHELALLLENMTEGEGFLLFHAMQNEFGWAGTVFCRGDVEDAWRTMHETDGDMPDEVWHKVQDDWGWRHMADMLAEAGNNSIWQALEEWS